MLCGSYQVRDFTKRSFYGKRTDRAFSSLAHHRWITWRIDIFSVLSELILCWSHFLVPSPTKCTCRFMKKISTERSYTRRHRNHNIFWWFLELFGREVTSGAFPWPQTILKQLEEWHVSSWNYRPCHGFGDHFLTSRQPSEKLQCLYKNLMSNSFRKTAVLKKEKEL